MGCVILDESQKPQEKKTRPKEYMKLNERNCKEGRSSEIISAENELEKSLEDFDENSRIDDTISSLHGLMIKMQTKHISSYNGEKTECLEFSKGKLGKEILSISLELDEMLINKTYETEKLKKITENMSVELKVALSDEIHNIFNTMNEKYKKIEQDEGMFKKYWTPYKKSIGLIKYYSKSLLGS